MNIFQTKDDKQVKINQIMKQVITPRPPKVLQYMDILTLDYPIFKMEWVSTMQPLVILLEKWDQTVTIPKILNTYSKMVIKSTETKLTI